MSNLLSGKTALILSVASRCSSAYAIGKRSRIFTTTLARSEDLLSEANRRLFVNACYWALGLECKIQLQAKVSLVGDCRPHPFGLGDQVKGLTPAMVAGH